MTLKALSRSRSAFIAVALLSSAFVLATSDFSRADAVSDGKATYSACSACHSVTGTEGVGPHLNGVIGRKAGAVPGYNYSRAMKSANIVWNAQTLDAYLANPQQDLPGNHMPFSGLPNATTRADIIAYLATLK